MARQLNLFPPAPRTYVIGVRGYDDVRYTAPSASKARAKAYRAFCDAITRKTFHEFLLMSRVRRAKASEGAAGEGDGDEM